MAKRKVRTTAVGEKGVPTGKDRTASGEKRVNVSQELLVEEEEEAVDDLEDPAEDESETDLSDMEPSGDDRKKSIYDILEEEITSSDMPETDKVKKLSHLLRLRSRSVNILVTGATGVGKSSTINALFNMEIAKVGVGVV